MDHDADRRPDQRRRLYGNPITSPRPSSRKPMGVVASHCGATGPSVGEPMRRREHHHGASHAGYSHAGPRPRLLRSVDRLRLRLRTALKEAIMIFDYSLAGLVSAGLLFYLTYALLRPERF